ncbi:hypothetical protein FACS1894216_01020 [Synergistales bacterium]|nr:hypothetical protein FACS1894216_01020 [Synergistales bacterium]
MSKRDETQANLVLESARQELARRSLLHFVTYTKPDYEVNWHHRVICEELDAFLEKDSARLILTMPPRFGKSELVSRRLPAFVLGRNPNTRIISCSYSSDLAQSMNRDVQRIIDEESYSLVFPDTALSSSNIRTVGHGTYLRNSDIFEVVGHRGMYLSAGVGGGVTGRGFDIGILDDVIKNREEANSPTYREKTWDWYTSTFFTRREKNAKILVIATRWHEDDLIGRLLEQQKDGGEQWQVINFPAVFEGRDEYTHEQDKRAEGDVLWPNKYDNAAMNDIRATIGSYDWASLYQQRPAPSGGGVFKEAWLRYYNPEALALDMKAKGQRFGIVIQSWDMTFKDADSGDYVVGQVWARRGGDFYLLDQIRAKMNFTDSVAAVKAMSSKYPEALTKLVEDKANGPAIINHLQHEVFGLHPVQPDGSKESRAQAVTPLFESGNVYIPEPSACPWVKDFTAELLTFPAAAHDDTVDAAVYALRYLAAGRGNVEMYLKAYGGDLRQDRMTRRALRK